MRKREEVELLGAAAAAQIYAWQQNAHKRVISDYDGGEKYGLLLLLLLLHHHLFPHPRKKLSKTILSVVHPDQTGYKEWGEKYF